MKIQSLRSNICDYVNLEAHICKSPQEKNNIFVYLHNLVFASQVCSRCSLRGNCERAYVKAQKKEVGRTIDVMRILLTYGLDSITGSVINQSCVNKTVKDSIKKLLKEMVELGFKEFGSGTEKTMVSGQLAIPMKQGDWICPKYIC